MYQVLTHSILSILSEEDTITFPSGHKQEKTESQGAHVTSCGWCQLALNPEQAMPCGARTVATEPCQEDDGTRPKRQKEPLELWGCFCKENSNQAPAEGTLVIETRAAFVWLQRCFQSLLKMVTLSRSHLYYDLLNCFFSFAPFFTQIIVSEQKTIPQF